MKTILPLFLIVLILGIVTSCNCKKKTTSKPDTAMQKEKIPQQNSFKILLKDDHCNIKEKEHLVITNLEDLKKVYGKINMTRRPGLPIPEIDFDKEMVVGIFLGEKSHAGYSIDVEKIITDDKTTAVLYKIQEPKGMASMVITQPGILVSIPKTDKPIRFALLEN